MTDFPIPLPPPPGSSEPPVWTGRGFRVDGALKPVLSYAVGESGWTDELTDFHEDVAGENHYIDVASRAHAVSRVARWAGKPGSVVMDIGCSSGFMLRALRERLPEAAILGADYVYGPLEKLARTMPGLPLLQFDLLRCPLPDCSLDAVVLLNVLEHLADDLTALRQIRRILKPGGVVVIEVPAGPHLFDVYDKQLMHFRRYDMKRVRHLLAEAGLEVAESSHLGFFLYPAFRFVKRRNQKYLSESDEVQRKIVAGNIQQQASNPVMHGLMKVEAAMRGLVPYPFGIRCLAVGRKT